MAAPGRARPAAAPPAAAAPKTVDRASEPSVTVVALSNGNGSVTTVKATVENIEDRRVPIVEGA
jgi:hypothetical protein